MRALLLLSLCFVFGCGDSLVVNQETNQNVEAVVVKRFIDGIVSFFPSASASFGHDHLPDIILGPPQGGGEWQNSYDVASLGCGGTIEVYFNPPGIIDGPGNDFTIFENAFRIRGAEQTSSEPGEISVSSNGTDWYTFSCDVTHSWPPTGCAGINPVLSSIDNDISPSDPARSGGDSFDIHDSGFSEVRFIRIQDKTAQYYGPQAPLYCNTASSGFDLDAIAMIHVGTL